MEKKKRLLLKPQLIVLKRPTKVCKVCFKEFTSFFIKDDCVCDKCYKEMAPIFKFMNIDGVRGMAIYPYNEKLKDIIYRFKGCYDIELKDVFLIKIKRFLQFYFHNFLITFVPSNDLDDTKRGFNHTREIFSLLNLQEIVLLKKASNFKQSSLSSYQRTLVKNKIKIINKINLSGKNILLCDDIITTKETMKACLSLIKSLSPKKIVFLSIALNCRKKS